MVLKFVLKVNENAVHSFKNEAFWSIRRFISLIWIEVNWFYKTSYSVIFLRLVYGILPFIAIYCWCRKVQLYIRYSVIGHKRSFPLRWNQNQKTVGFLMSHKVFYKCTHIDVNWYTSTNLQRKFTNWIIIGGKYLVFLA